MGSSFYRARTNAALRTGSQVFSDLINAGPVPYGLTVLQGSDFEALNDDFAAKLLISEAPTTRSKTTIQSRNSAKLLLVAKAAELAGIVEHNPAVTDTQRAALGLSVRATPQPSPAPGTCNRFKTMLLADGSIEMTWKANNPTGMSGVTYQVWRRFGSEGPFTYIGGTGEKKFVDSTIPVGTAQAQYQIRGIRPTGAGAWAQYNVNFGEATSGAATAAGVQSKVSPNVAA